MTVTYGFELEFQQGADRVAAWLHEQDRSLIGSPHLHGYHCDCDECDFGNFPLRGQTDSSCSGEIISDVLTFPEGFHLLTRLENAAIAVDAEPGYDAGFHVHVQRPVDPRVSLLAYLLWEPAFELIARGRFQHMRSCNNMVRSEIYWEPTLPEILDAFHNGQTVDLHNVAERVYDMDRHAWLNTNTRFDTWEFRLWGATRSAWRMEMFIRTSILLREITVSEALLAAWKPGDSVDTTDKTAELVALLGPFDARLHELLKRQYRYATAAPRDLPFTS